MRTGTSPAVAAIAALLVATLAVSGTSAALSTRAGAGGSTTSRAATPHVALGLSDVPWSSVGPNWLLATWLPHPHAAKPYGFLELVSPLGARYVLYRISLFDQIADWSGDGQRVLLQQSTNRGVVIRTLDLRTGQIEQSFSLPDFASARFTRPLGLAVLASEDRASHMLQLTRYSLSGAVQRAFPAAIGGLGGWDDSWIMSPNGNQLVLGFHGGLAVMGNDGSLVARLLAPAQHDCAPTRWWTSTVVLARCFDRSAAYGNPHLFLFSAAWTGPRALTRVPVQPDFGDLNAWKVNSSVYVQASSGCGPGWLGKLDGVVPRMVSVPPFGAQPANGIEVLGANSHSLALLTTTCVGQALVAWYTPATNTNTLVLGPPLSGGAVGQVLVYPTPMG